MTPSWLYFVDSSVPTGRDPVAVAVLPAGLGGWHTGILHRRQRGPTEFLHLAWHWRLANDPVPGDCAWVVPQSSLATVPPGSPGETREKLS